MNDLESFDSLLDFIKKGKSDYTNDHVCFLKEAFLGVCVNGSDGIHTFSEKSEGRDNKFEGLIFLDFRRGGKELNGGSPFFVIAKNTEDAAKRLIKRPYQEVPKGIISDLNGSLTFSFTSEVPMFKKMLMSEYERQENIKNAAVAPKRDFGILRTLGLKKTGGRKRHTRSKRAAKSKRRRG